MKKKGGLLVLGTNMQDSRRSENQLKGRAARQGDPGETLMMYDIEDIALTTDSDSTKLMQCKQI